MTHLDSPFAAAVVLALSVAGCGAAQPKQSGEENNFDAPASTSAPAASSEPAASGKGDGDATGDGKSGGASGDLTEDQQKQMEIALHRGNSKVVSCADTAGAAPGEGEIEVIMDGKIGKITEVNVGKPWAGTPAEACIKRAFVNEYILPFEGEPKSVPFMIKIPDKNAPAAKTPPKKKK